MTEDTDQKKLSALIEKCAQESFERVSSMSNEEIYGVSDDHWSTVSKTYIENWPQALHDLSIRSTGLWLTEKTARVLGSEIPEYGESFDVSDIPEDERGKMLSFLLSRVREAMSEYPDGVFIRLGSRSPKDAWLLDRPDLRSGHVRTAEDALVRLTACSERIYEDLQTHLAMKMQPWIWVREWVEMEGWQEFRCFMENRQLTGISQYDYHLGRQEEVVEHHQEIADSIRKFFSEKFLDAIHVDSVVFDVVVSRGESGWDVKLLEINPFGCFTDPCLFTWREPTSFDGSIKYCTEPAEVRSRRSMLEELAELDEDEAQAGNAA